MMFDWTFLSDGFWNNWHLLSIKHGVKKLGVKSFMDE